MNSGRQTMAHRINNQGREKIFPPEVTELPQAQLQRKLGFRPATSRQKVQTWKLYDNEFINSDDYIDEHTPQSIFRGDFMFRVSFYTSMRTQLKTRSILDCSRHPLRAERG
jgi:hypothetical protein